VNAGCIGGGSFVGKRQLVVEIWGAAGGGNNIYGNNNYASQRVNSFGKRSKIKS